MQYRGIAFDIKVSIERGEWVWVVHRRSRSRESSRARGSRAFGLPGGSLTSGVSAIRVIATTKSSEIKQVVIERARRDHFIGLRERYRG
jgi:hypothetical protein